MVDPETRRSGAARKYSATMAARTTAQLPGQVNVTDGVSLDPDSPDDLVAASKSKKGRPPTLPRMNTEDLISMPVGRDETSGKLTGQLSGPSASEGPPPLLRKQSSLLKLAELKKPPLKRQPGGAWGDKCAAVTDASSKAGEGRPPPLNRVDTEDLINLDPDSHDDLVAASKSKEGRPPTLPRMNTEDLISMPVGEDETSGQSTTQLSGPSASGVASPPLVRRQSSLLKLAEMKKLPLKRQPDGAWGDKSAAVTDAASASKAGEGRPPPLYRVDTEDLISLDPESPDDLVTAGSRKATIADTSSKRLR